MDKIPVYLMPGLAASPAIFERIALPPDQFEVVLLEWQIPTPNESLVDYAKRMAQKVTQPNPVLVGVSFGGILVQEMAQFLSPRKVIIISSVRCNEEFPRRMKVTKMLRAYKLIPADVVGKIERLAKLSRSQLVRERMKLYDKFLSVRDDRYFQWAIRNVILWDRTQIDANVVHIHGDADEVFPIKYIKDCRIVKGGTHIMILNKFRWLNEHLPKIIRGEE
ncbi:alpha/beta hydrolase [Flavobacterium caeni]|uniref:Pimeloyl-ACP methyl ester carboxylesterase n=1 Tax=Flavobacterium caeni TaxID=490189 RepID=A0A1G5HN84_9FLAO|nr:alpha/beta hydrolase [Flavobacterium caeni]SCY65332.1 Pimeloyl-ACP methyl ester carboxylesterase [Flavobacterium caeni]